MQVLLNCLVLGPVNRGYVIHVQIYEHILLYYHFHTQLYLYIFLNRRLLLFYNKNLSVIQAYYLSIEN